MKKIAVIVLTMTVIISLFSAGLPSNAAINADAVSLILIEANTGKVLYENNADEKLPPASVTKVMTMLLVMEAIDSKRITLDEIVTVSDHAASMGGSQVFLEPNEQMSVEDLLKSVVIASANDAACALAEHICGSHDLFVEKMNERATELGMVNTHFENTNGLDDTTENHLTTARDIALMSAELIVNHPAILKYSSTWQDSIRNGEFVLTNTNRLIRFYQGANGLKTGSTSKAKFCISASACRDGLQLIAVVMGSSSRDNRNASAKALLDYGFSTYSYSSIDPNDRIEINVAKGKESTLKAGYNQFRDVVPKGKGNDITVKCELPNAVTAPIKAGDVVGKVVYTIDEEKIAEQNIYALESVERMTFGEMLSRLVKKYFLI